MQSTPPSTFEQKPSTLRWFHPTPARFLALLLAVEGGLLLSERLGCWHKNYAVLVAIGCIGAMMALMLVWWMLALCLHWRFQFSLRSLFVLTVAIAIPFSWLAVEMKTAREQREAVEEVRRVGGFIRYDHEDQPGATLTPFATPGPNTTTYVWSWTITPQSGHSGPMWLQKLLGEDFFADVIGVFLSGRKVTDKSLENLRALTRLRGVTLDDIEVTDRGLEHLKTLTQLERLWFNDSKVTDRSVKELRKALPKCHIVR